MRGVKPMDCSPKGLLLSWLDRITEEKLERISNEYLRTKLNVEHYLEKDDEDSVFTSMTEFISNVFVDNEPHSEWLEASHKLEEFMLDIAEKQDD